MRPILLLCSVCCWLAALDQAGRDQARAELRQLAAESTRLSRCFNLVHELVGPSVVSIRTKERQVVLTWGGRAVREVDAGEGSGFIVAADAKQAWILTNAHVVVQSDGQNGFQRKRDGSYAGYDRLRVVLHDNREADATYVGVDVPSDLALIRVPIGGLPAAEWADSEQVHVGDWVLALGYPLGVGYSASAGIVSATDRSTGIYEAVGGFESFIQTDTAINPGNSGGPLVDIQGRIVGVNSNIKSSTGANIGLGSPSPRPSPGASPRTCAPTVRSGAALWVCAWRRSTPMRRVPSGCRRPRRCASPASTRSPRRRRPASPAATSS